MHDALLIMPAAYATAEKKSIHFVAPPTPEICAELLRMKTDGINAVLHVTC